MKEKMQEWARNNWANLSEKSAKSVINRVIAVIEKEPATIKSALVGLTQSLNALASKEDTSESDTAEIWFISEFITAMLLPIAEHIDAITKAKSAKAPKKRAEVWADSLEEAIALRDAQTPAKPTRKARTSDTSTALGDDAIIRDILAQLATLRISK